MYTINYNFNDISSHPSNCRRHGYFLQYPFLMYNGIFSYHPKQFHIQPYFQSLYYSIEEIKKNCQMQIFQPNAHSMLQIS